MRYLDIPVYGLARLNDATEDCLLIIASERYKAEIYANRMQLMPEHRFKIVLFDEVLEMITDKCVKRKTDMI